ncbi:MAG: response regulator transcription factor [Chloroflexi bacterium]|nr:response regulator transcription factor [Chloroflexota bacterium]
MNKQRILVVDDEPRYVRAIQVNLEARGFQVITAPDGQTAINLAARENPDLILLDIRMPQLDGYETCRRIRNFSNVPVIMLTALSEPNDKVKGLDLGADDYVTKPFNAEELVARVRAGLRRGASVNPEEPQATLTAHGIVLDLARQRVWVDERPVNLTSIEFRLLTELMRHVNTVMSPEVLLEKVWGIGYEGEFRLVWRAIHRLRQKIERDPSHPERIETRAGSGYMISRE